MLKRTAAILITSAIILGSCSSIQKKADSAAAARVEAFLGDMIAKETEARLYSHISKDFLKRKAIDTNSVFVDIYGATEYELLSCHSGYCEVIISRPENGWRHKLIFKLRYENGEAYILPFYSEGAEYIRPWYAIIKEYIKTD